MNYRSVTDKNSKGNTKKETKNTEERGKRKSTSYRKCQSYHGKKKGKYTS